MSRFRLALLAAALSSALAAPTAEAGRPSGYPETITTQHFQIHYTGSSGFPEAIVHQQAADLAALAERAYTIVVTEWGYPAPLNDGDGKTDVWVLDFQQGIIGIADVDTSANQSSGWFAVDVEAIADITVITHELFHLVQFGLWVPMDAWLMEATAEWAGFRAAGYPVTVHDWLSPPQPLLESIAPPDMSLTCIGDACAVSDYDRYGYSRWPYFEYVAERFGVGFPKEIFERGKSANDTGLTGTDLLTLALQNRGQTLADSFTDWSVANLNGNYTAEGLKGMLPAPYSTTQTGGTSGPLPLQRVAVNHLAARNLVFQRGDGTTGQCYAATLSLDVTLPSGLGARPYFYWTAPGSTPTALAISGDKATLSIPWDTCSWEYSGLLVLPNPTWNVDAAVFTVSASLTVDQNTIVSSTAPPPGWAGPTVPAPLVEQPPAIAVYGPETLRVSAKKRLLRLLVFSSGSGWLQASIGGSQIGERTLRAGNNEIRFTLPRELVRSLAARGTLTLTSVSSSGTTGATVTKKIKLTK